MSVRRNLPLLLLQAREALMANFRPILKHFGLTEQQWRIIRTLVENGPLEPHQLCSQCQILSPSLAGVLARMDELGLVQRQRFSNDLRRVLVSPTQRAQAIYEALTPISTAQYQAIEQTWGADTLAALTQALDQLLAKQHLPVPAVSLPPELRARSESLNTTTTNTGSPAA